MKSYYKNVPQHITFDSQSGTRYEGLYLTAMLLLYSLTPGISKLLDNRTIFVTNIGIIFALLISNRIKRFSVGGILLLVYITHTLVFTTLLISTENANEFSGYTSYYMYILPMLGFFIGARVNPENLVRAFFGVALLHAILGFLFYDFFALPGVLGTVVEKLKDGVFQFRMASVSGSIVFGAVMLYGLISSAYLYRKTQEKLYALMLPIFLICIILSQQRSAWGCSLLFLIWYFSKNIKETWPILVFLFLLVLTGIYILTSISPEMIDFFILRLTGSFGDSDNSNIVNERSHMWLNALEQFKKNIFGLGAGQGGWISYIHDVNTNIVVTDGDYFRILLESGIFGIIVFCYLIGIVLLRFIRNGDSKVKYFYWFSVASGIQMVGSNITELYYANFAFWLALGLNHKFKHGKYLAASQKVVRYVA